MVFYHYCQIRISVFYYYCKIMIFGLLLLRDGFWSFVRCEFWSSIISRQMFWSSIAIARHVFWSSITIVRYVFWTSIIICPIRFSCLLSITILVFWFSTTIARHLFWSSITIARQVFWTSIITKWDALVFYLLPDWVFWSSVYYQIGFILLLPDKCSDLSLPLSDRCSGLQLLFLEEVFWSSIYCRIGILAFYLLSDWFSGILLISLNEFFNYQLTDRMLQEIIQRIYHFDDRVSPNQFSIQIHLTGIFVTKHATEYYGKATCIKF